MVLRDKFTQQHYLHNGICTSLPHMSSITQTLLPFLHQFLFPLAFNSSQPFFSLSLSSSPSTLQLLATCGSCPCSLRKLSGTRNCMTTSRVTTNWGSLILHGVNPTGKEIGRGAYGRVFEVDYEGTLCAAKEVHALLLQYAQGDDLEKIKDDFLSECQIWSTLRHPCVVQFLGSVILVV